MNAEYNLKELKSILPGWAKIEISKAKNHIAIDVKLVPNVTQKEHDIYIKSIVDLFGEDLMEVYTETEGYHFIIYLYISKTKPTVISI